MAALPAAQYPPVILPIMKRAMLPARHTAVRHTHTMTHIMLPNTAAAQNCYNTWIPSTDHQSGNPYDTSDSMEHEQMSSAKRSDKQIIFDTHADRSKIADQAIADQDILVALVDNLSAEQRRVRQFSAAAIKEISKNQTEVLITYISEITDGLFRPEAQTRWECLEALSYLTQVDPLACDNAIEGAEASLYDEDSGSARLAALRFLCAYGATDNQRASKVWPLIEEAIQCYHGDPEFNDMLVSVATFADGEIGSDVRESLLKRMQFDAANAKGQIGRSASAIVEICRKGQS
jgi:hypothetical protein